MFQAALVAAALQLVGASGTLAIRESRCGPALGGCGTVEMKSSFSSAANPRTRAIAGLRGFRSGVRIAGSGRGTCQAVSPEVVITGPDGSQQLLGGAVRITPGRFASTDVVIRSGRRGMRWTWLEPLAPGFGCTYFDDPATALAVPPSTRRIVPALSSRWIAPAALRRRTLVVRIAGARSWRSTAADGTVVRGHGAWTLRLRYTPLRRPAFAG